jgi:hypothetical protein
MKWQYFKISWQPFPYKSLPIHHSRFTLSFDAVHSELQKRRHYTKYKATNDVVDYVLLNKQQTYGEPKYTTVLRLLLHVTV